MISRRFVFRRLIACTPLLVCAEPAFADKGSYDSGVGVDQFDLAQTRSANTVQQRYRLNGNQRVERFRREKTRVRWAFDPLQGGPSVELAALGGGRKGTPKLANVRIGWHF